MTGIAFFALALLAALVVGGGRRQALASGWRRGPERSPAASPALASASFPPRAGCTAGPSPRGERARRVAEAA